MELKIKHDEINIITNTVSNSVRRMFLAIKSVYANILEENKIALHEEQVPVLLSIYLVEGISQKELATNLERNKSSIQRTINQLKNKNLINEIKAEKDKRTSVLSVTDEGYSIAKHCIKLALEAEEIIFKAFNQVEKEDLIKRLSLIAEDLEEKYKKPFPFNCK